MTTRPDPPSPHHHTPLAALRLWHAWVEPVVRRCSCSLCSSTVFAFFHVHSVLQMFVCCLTFDVTWCSDMRCRCFHVLWLCFFHLLLYSNIFIYTRIYSFMFGWCSVCCLILVLSYSLSLHLVPFFQLWFVHLLYVLLMYVVFAFYSYMVVPWIWCSFPAYYDQKCSFVILHHLSESFMFIVCISCCFVHVILDFYLYSCILICPCMS